jgi:DGQHR domain-containing protein
VPNSLIAPGFELQREPRIYVARLPGIWLLAHTSPSWRIENPVEGFQRIVREDRARAIATAVLEQQRTFPNAIVLATDAYSFRVDREGFITIPAKARFLVVDGQHRLWAQKFSSFVAEYACLLHMGLSEVQMARLFLEINDNQKRVPSSLRWDLVRLVRPEDDPVAIAATEMVLLLATDDQSPLFQRVDLTGEQAEIQLKQGSIAPELKRLLGLGPRSPLQGLSFDGQYEVVLRFLAAVRDLDPDHWGTSKSPFYGARILRALVRLLPEIAASTRKDPTSLTVTDFFSLLKRIKKASLDTEAIRQAQGNAGIAAIYKQLRKQIFPGGDNL